MATTIITDQPLEFSYTAAPGQDEFDFGFQVFNGTADLVVVVEGEEVGAYSITLNEGASAEGGYITLDEECLGGETVIIRRELAVERVTQFPNTGPVPMEQVNHELNRMVGLIQQLHARVEELSEEIGYDDEKARDAIGSALAEGVGIDVEVDDDGNTITLSNTITVETIRDTIAAALSEGAGIEIVVDDENDLIVIQSTGELGGGLTSEDVRDIIGTALSSGAGIDIVVDDPSNTITISNTSGAYSDEEARDAIGAALVEGTGIDIVIDDSGETITVSVVSTKTLSFFVPASAMKPRTTNGAATGNFESTTNDINFDTLDFDSSTSEGAHFHFRMPKSVDEAGNFSARFGWLTAVASGGVRWGLKYLVLRDDVVIDAAMTSAAAVSDTVLATSKLHMSAATANFTITGLQAEDLVVFEVYRDPSHGDDTMAGDARLLWLDLKVPFAGFDDA